MFFPMVKKGQRSHACGHGNYFVMGSPVGGHWGPNAIMTIERILCFSVCFFFNVVRLT